MFSNFVNIFLELRKFFICLTGRWNDFECELYYKRQFAFCQRSIKSNQINNNYECKKLFEENQLLKEKLKNLESKIRRFQSCASDLF
jgi:hypothetical protein